MRLRFNLLRVQTPETRSERGPNELLLQRRICRFYDGRTIVGLCEKFQAKILFVLYLPYRVKHKSTRDLWRSKAYQMQKLCALYNF